MSCLAPVLVFHSLRGSVTQEGKNQDGLLCCFAVPEQFWQPPYLSAVNSAHKKAVRMHTNIAIVSLHAWQKDKESEQTRSLLELLNMCDERKLSSFVKGK